MNKVFLKYEIGGNKLSPESVRIASALPAWVFAKLAKV